MLNLALSISAEPFLFGNYLNHMLQFKYFNFFPESTAFEGLSPSPTIAPPGPTEESWLNVGIVTQSFLDVELTGPTGTATTTIEITTPSIEELAIGEFK